MVRSSHVVRDSRSEPEAELKFRAVAEAALDAIVLADIRGNIMSWSSGAEVIFGYTEAEVTGKSLTILMPASFRDAPLAGIERLRETGKRHRVGRTSELSALHKDGHEFPIEISLGTWVTTEGRFFCGIIRDITERKVLEEAFRQAALHDVVTKLPNRVFFAERLKESMAVAIEEHTWIVVLMIDVDNFKSVNDHYGHQVGDALLVAIGERLTSTVRRADTVARYGGDEFIVLMAGFTTPSQAAPYAARVTDCLKLPYDIDGLTIKVTASVGVGMRGNAGFVPEDLLRDADSALYVAKEKGKAQFCF